MSVVLPTCRCPKTPTKDEKVDSLKERKKILLDPEAYVDQCKGHPTVIDESQLVPELFPALKERVRKNKKPGQFILSGSVRFTSKKAIRESLTGRIQYLELLPMTVSEIHHHELPTVISELLNSRSFYSLESKLKTLSSLSHKKFKSIHDYRMQGGLPGVCFMRDLKLRRATWENYLQTILDRDLRQVFPTTLSFDRLLEFMEVIAKSQGEPYRYQTVREQTGLTPITQQKLLYALESVFLIRRMKIEGVPHVPTTHSHAERINHRRQYHHR
jgi:predicted AAA+ superfamily ATPase